MTVHYISDSFQRKSYTLACKRILYNHDYKNIALTVHHILIEFTLDVSKITHVVTDNATNFGKAFRCFGVTKLEKSNQNQFMSQRSMKTFQTIRTNRILILKSLKLEKY